MKKFYTDGIKTIKLSENDPIPKGFYPGRTFKSNPWNKGLTADIDDRVRINAEHCHQTRRKTNNYHSWNKGLTKETNSSLKIVSEKLSVEKLGKKPWNKGIPVSQERKQKQSEAMKIVSALKTPEQKAIANEKSYQTKKSNNSFNISKPEETYYEELCSRYGRENILRQFKSDKYPFNCDFYIISEDLYIELNASWTHGPHPFDSTDPSDLKLKNLWEEKAKTSKYYRNALDVWTKRDVQKLQTLRNNKLNFHLIYRDSIISD